MGTTHEIVVTVNGRRYERSIPARQSLADFLRDDLELTGTRLGCEHGVCGCCTILLDGEPVRSCIVLAAQADGHDVTTVEGLSGPAGELSPLQEAFCETHALQCGYCTSGMLIAAEALLRDTPRPTRAEIDTAIGGNICRCTGYVQIREAIELAGERRATGAEPLDADATRKPEAAVKDG
jgi:aerobic-type carbon monoxide dehydrogenase small subunit (CoxS/CutS family)